VKQLSAGKHARLKHKVGIALNVEWAEPLTGSEEDKAAAQRNLDIQFGLFADPLFFGRCVGGCGRGCIFRRLGACMIGWRRVDVAWRWMVESKQTHETHACRNHRSYPPLLKQKFGGEVIKNFTPEQSAALKGSVDWLGINFYTAKFVKANGNPLGFVVTNWGPDGKPIGPQAQSSWLRVVPDGLYKITQYASKRYGRPEIRITGEWADADGWMDG
jgi:beta-glucosidase/6-phospho-beta-glucosidase/beta-galactosidase